MGYYNTGSKSLATFFKPYEQPQFTSYAWVVCVIIYGGLVLAFVLKVTARACFFEPEGYFWARKHSQLKHAEATREQSREG